MLDSNAIDIFTADSSTIQVGYTPYGQRIERRFNEPQLLDRRLRAYAKERSRLDAAEAFDLARAHEMGIHRYLGCSSFFDYMERALGYAPHAVRERLRVARSLRNLPAIATQMTTGTLSYSHVRELTRVATPDTERAWLAAVVDRNATEVQTMVAGHAYGDLPDDPTVPDLRPRTMQLELTPEVLALWREARAVLADERGGGELSDTDLMGTLCRRFLAPGTGADRPASNIGYTQCRDCKRATVNGAGRELDVSPAAIEHVACDARVLGNLDAPHPERVTTTVTPRMREQVFARDGHRCRVPGCRSAAHLEVHHIIEQSRGGPHALWNLILLCDGHHRALHDGLISITGRAPYEVQFRWTFQPIDFHHGPTEPRDAPKLPADVGDW
jgi:hypothetical protein